MAKRNAQGAGTIRKKTVTRNGKDYTYWEARITTGRDPGTGKQIQQSFSGKTQKEVREKMQAAAVEVNAGTYIPPAKMTVGQWLDIWLQEYINDVKPRTAISYRSNVENHIRPSLGAVRLIDLRPHTIQTFINSVEGLAPGSLRHVYKVLHAALEKAVALEYIPKNPTAHCVLPKDSKKEIHPLEDGQISALLTAAKGSPIEYIISVSLFTGLRISEVIGLTWDCVNFTNGIITVDKQISGHGFRDEHGLFVTPKSGSSRNITVAPTVLATLKEQRRKQSEMRLLMGQTWDNPHNLVFTREDGSPWYQYNVTNRFQTIVSSIGLDSVRFHDLRHTYAVNSIRAGDDIKTIQGNLGHASAAFTLDKYGHFTERMKQDSAARMEAFIKANLNL